MTKIKFLSKNSDVWVVGDGIECIVCIYVFFLETGLIRGQVFTLILLYKFR